MNIDAKLIMKLVKKSEKYNYEPDEEGYIRDKDLEIYISESVKKIYESSMSTLPDMLARRNSLIDNRINSEIEISKGLFFSSLLHAIFNYIIDGKSYENPYEECTYLLMHHLFDIYQAVLDLMITDHNLSCLIQARILYEALTIMTFIMKYPVLAEPYLDHSVYSKKRILNLNKNNTINMDDAQFNEFSDKYPEDFFHDYGWTYSIIKDKKSRKLLTLANEVDLQEYSTFYRVASEATHSSSLFVNASYNKNYIVSYFGINSVSVELISNGLMKLMKAWKIKNENLIYLRNIIYSFREELFHEPKGYGEKET